MAVAFRCRRVARRPVLFYRLAMALAASLAALPAWAEASLTTGPHAGSGPGVPQDLSPVAMFLAADVIVQGVMMALAAASFLTWLIWLAKTLELLVSKARARRGLRAIATARSLDQAWSRLKGGNDAVADMLRGAVDEVALSGSAAVQGSGTGLKERVGMLLQRIDLHHASRMARGTGLLATIGSVAPFVGLFGTVWGIMNAFIGIGKTQTTNLAVVAPGIAEALLATAIGLVAAIPAVIIYNLFARSIAGYRRMLGDAASAIERLVSRDIDIDRAAGTGVHAGIRPAAE